ncbi:hypothetical protein T4A_14327 [Trichinella pseudospiralis]|uniref:Uncharacterized protein n=1 Tax=Trichinella pseudospiralis TaxID=6337 RepID=A0A0V1EHD0_TRIPS|nr:hypothetical protein T4A_14327 [Trichinella pseudospiralis]
MNNFNIFFGATNQETGTEAFQRCDPACADTTGRSGVTDSVQVCSERNKNSVGENKQYADDSRRLFKIKDSSSGASTFGTFLVLKNQECNIAKARVLTSLIDHERLDYFNSTSNWYIENKQWCTLFSDLWYEISEMFHYNKHFSLTGLYLMNSLVNNYKNGYKLKLRGENECKEALMHTYRIIELNKKLFSSNKK